MGRVHTRIAECGRRSSPIHQERRRCPAIGRRRTVLVEEAEVTVDHLPRSPTASERRMTRPHRPARPRPAPRRAGQTLERPARVRAALARVTTWASETWIATQRLPNGDRKSRAHARLIRRTLCHGQFMVRRTLHQSRRYFRRDCAQVSEQGRSASCTLTDSLHARLEWGPAHSSSKSALPRVVNPLQ
jgi:hypothetical protein